MKATIKLSESREEDRTIHRRGGDLSLLWISILAVLFYLASIIAALAEEPLVPDNGLKSVSMTSSPATPKPRQSWLRRLFYRPTWSEVLEQCKTPRDVCNTVGRYVGYRTEDVDRWTSAEETWQAGRGDCEDMAVCIETLCHELGFSATVNLYYSKDPRYEGHAVAVGTWGGRMWMSSNGSYEEVDSIDEVKESIARMYGCSGDELWSAVLAHDDIERRLRRSAGRPVAAAIGR